MKFVFGREKNGIFVHTSFGPKNVLGAKTAKTRKH